MNSREKLEWGFVFRYRNGMLGITLRGRRIRLTWIKLLVSVSLFFVAGVEIFNL